MKNLLIIILTSISLITNAQDANRPKVEEMHARKWQYIVEHANLTAQEANAAQPVFMEYEQTVWKLMEKNKPAFMKNKNTNEKPNFEEMNERFVNIEMQKAQLLKAYYQKLKKVVSAETIFKMGKADRSFRNELIRDWQDKKNKKHNN